MRRKSPSARLIDFTSKPFKLVHTLFFHDKHGAELNLSGPTSQKEFNFVLQLLKEDWCGLLEFPVFIWQMVLPRSLHAQVRVHRHWSFFSQSHQLHEPTCFADEGDYFEIPGLDARQNDLERIAMEDAQHAYGKLRDSGLLPSLARGVLPMHINLGLSVATNLRALFQVAVQRRCHILQGTYWNPLLDMMRDELVAKVDERFKSLFELQPCDVMGRCLSNIEQGLRMELKDPHATCPRWAEMQRTSGARNCCGNGCVGCLKHARTSGRKVERRIDQ